MKLSFFMIFRSFERFESLLNIGCGGKEFVNFKNDDLFSVIMQCQFTQA